MARRAIGSGMSIAQIERLLADRRQELNEKQREHSKLSARLQQLEADIHRLGGNVGRRGRGGGGGTRARNDKSLLETLEDVLKNGKPMKVGDIADAAQKSGYRSNSANFRSIVNQTLIKDKRFGSAGRGIYQLKKAS
jgi:DNA-binding transcriptional MerR regulator